LPASSRSPGRAPPPAGRPPPGGGGGHGTRAAAQADGGIPPHPDHPACVPAVLPRYRRGSGGVPWLVGRAVHSPPAAVRGHLPGRLLDLVPAGDGVPVLADGRLPAVHARGRPRVPGAARGARTTPAGPARGVLP